MRKVYVGARRTLATEEWQRLGWSEQHAERLASLTPSGIGPYVLVATPHGVEPLRHHVCHSPTGFEWGYTANGPAELARCILIDHIVFKDGKGDELLVSYQAFKLDIIAKLPRTGVWSLTTEEIDAWAAMQRRSGRPGENPSSGGDAGACGRHVPARVKVRHSPS